jgi:hypothetical protein
MLSLSIEEVMCGSEGVVVFFLDVGVTGFAKNNLFT